LLCCVHPRPGEALAAAAHRRLMEEMGFDRHGCTIGTFVRTLVFDAEFLDSEFDTNNGPYGRYRVSAFERGTWLDVVASALLIQLREEGDATRH
jgi:isopentenyldiphosphate isomerase